MVINQILKYVNKNVANIRCVDKEFAKQLNFKGIKFPVNEEDYAKIEKQNNISNKHFDVLLLSN